MTAFNQSCLATNSPVASRVSNTGKLLRSASGWSYPGCAWDADFPGMRGFNGSPASISSMLTNTNSSGGSHVDANGNVIWFPPNVLRHTNRSLLAEPAATNLQLHSQQFTVSPWATGNGGTAGVAPTVTDNQGVAPDGTTTAALVQIPSRSSAAHYQYVNSPQSLATNTYTGSLWFKAQTGGDVGKKIDMWQFDGAVKNLITITLTASWQRVSTGGALNGIGNLECDTFGKAASAGGGDLTAANFYVWGAQIEVGKYASSYIQTTTATVQRAADSIALSSASTYLGAGPWSLLCEGLPIGVPSANAPLFSVDDGTTSNSFYIYTASGASGFTGNSGGGGGAFSLSGASWTVATQFRAGEIFRPGSASFVSVNGNNSNNTVVPPNVAMTKILLASGDVGGETGQAVEFTRFTIWKSDVSNAQMHQYCASSTTSSSNSGAATLVRKTNKPFTIASSMVASLVRQPGKVLVIGATIVSSLVRQLGRSIVSVPSIAATLVRLIGKPLPVTIVPAAALVRLTNKSSRATVTASSTLVRAMARAALAVSNNTAMAGHLAMKYLVRPVTVVAALTFIRRIISKPRLRALFGNPTLRGEID